MARSKSRTGDSYLASLSDLMIGLLFIFIIILMAFTLSYRAAQQSSEQAQTELVAVNKALTDSDSLRAQMLREIQQSLKRQGIPVEIDTESGVLRLPESLLFDSGSSDFRSGGGDAIAKVADSLASILPCYSGGGVAQSGSYCPRGSTGRIDSVFVEGHTDNVPVQNLTFRDNWDLSVARARKTYDSLFARTALLGRLTNVCSQPLFSMAAYGDTRPVGNNSSAEGRAMNRRIDLRFIMTVPSELSLPSSGDTQFDSGILSNEQTSKKPCGSKAGV